MRNRGFLKIAAKKGDTVLGCTHILVHTFQSLLYFFFKAASISSTSSTALGGGGCGCGRCCCLHRRNTHHIATESVRQLQQVLRTVRQFLAPGIPLICLRIASSGG